MEILRLGDLGCFQCCLTAMISGDRKLEAYATWGKLPACLPSHWQRDVPDSSQTFSSAQGEAGLMN